MKVRAILFTSLAILISGLIWSAARQSTAQDPAAEVVDAAASEDDAHRRLPPYFSDLVTPGQRVKIYTIQDKYEAQIEELKKQLRDLVAKRDAEVDAVLEPEQRKLLEVVKENSRLLRAARAKAAEKLKEELPTETVGEQ